MQSISSTPKRLEVTAVLRAQPNKDNDDSGWHLLTIVDVSGCSAKWRVVVRQT